MTLDEMLTRSGDPLKAEIERKIEQQTAKRNAQNAERDKVSQLIKDRNSKDQ